MRNQSHCGMRTPSGRAGLLASDVFDKSLAEIVDTPKKVDEQLYQIQTRL